MFGSVSPYQQMQNWRTVQGRVNNYIMGGPSTVSAPVDFSGSFASAASGYYTTLANLAARAAITRTQNANAASSTTAATNGRSSSINTGAGLAAAQATGAAVLADFGFGGAASSANSSHSSASGPYQAPINPATGYSYVGTSAGSVGALNAVNFLV